MHYLKISYSWLFENLFFFKLHQFNTNHHLFSRMLKLYENGVIEYLLHDLEVTSKNQCDKGNEFKESEFENFLPIFYVLLIGSGTAFGILTLEIIWKYIIKKRRGEIKKIPFHM